MQLSPPVPPAFKTPTIPQDLQFRLEEVTGLFNRFHANLAAMLACAPGDLSCVESLLIPALAEAHAMVVTGAMRLHHPRVAPPQSAQAVSMAPGAPAAETLATPGLPDHPYNRAYQAALDVHTEPTPSAVRETLRTFWQGLLPEELAEPAWRELCLDTLPPQVAEDLFDHLNKPVYLWPRFRLHEVITDDDFDDYPGMGTQLRSPTWVQTISTAEAVRRGKLTPTSFLTLVRSRVREHCDHQLRNQLLSRNSALQETFSPTLPSPLATLPSQPSQH